MKKALVAVVAIAGLGGLAGPKIIGNNAHDQLLEMLRTIDDMPGYSVVLKESQRGWFSSQNVLEVAFDLSEFMPDVTEAQKKEMKMLDALSFDINLDLNFGPVLGGSGLGLVSWYAHVPTVPEMITLVDKSKTGLYEMRGKQSLSGGISYEDAIPAFEVTSDEMPGKIAFSGFSGVAKPQGKQVHYVGRMQSLTFSGAGNNASATDLTMDFVGNFDTQAFTTGIYGDSKMKMGLGKLLVQEGDNALVDLEGFSFFADTQLSEDNALDMRFGYGSDRVQSPMGAFEDIELAFAMDNVSVKFIQEYQALTSDVNNMMNPEAMIPALTKSGIEALAFKPEFAITNMGLKTPEGELTSSASLKLSDYMVTEENVMNPAFWQKNVLLESNISLPKTLAFTLGQQFVMNKIQEDPAAADMPPEQLAQIAQQQIAPMFDAFKQQGLIVEEGDLVKLSFNVKDGKGSLNGKPVPLPGMMP